MQDRGQELQARLTRIKRTAIWTGVAVAVSVAAMAANAGCNARASAELSSLGHLEGYGYDIDASAVGPDFVRVSVRATYLPMINSYNNLSRAQDRLRRACGEFQTVEDAADKIKAKKDGMVLYATVPNRLACLGQ